MATFQQKHYDSLTDRLFLVYYALDDSLNLNGWRVSPESLEQNIRSFVGKPAVLKQKDPFSDSDRSQTGKFVHPIMKNASLTENLTFQERFSVGRINNVYRNDKGWRFDVEITDPEMKEVLKSADYADKYPRWVSPQIATFPDAFPDENDTNVQHWHGLHLAFVDMPAFGFAKTDMAGKCYGSEQECKIKLHSAASKNDVGFCIKSASVELLSAAGSTSNPYSHSSHDSIQSSKSHMSQDVSSQPSDVQQQHVNQTSTGYTVSADGNWTADVPISAGNKQEEQPPNSPPAPGSQAERDSVVTPGDTGELPEPQPKNVEEKESQANLPKSLEEAIQQINALRQMNKDRDKQYNRLEKQIGEINKERGYLKAMSLIPRDLFRTENEFRQEATKVLDMYLSKGIPEDEIKRIYKDRAIAKTLSGVGSGGCSCGGGSSGSGNNGELTVAPKSAAKINSSVKPWTLDIHDMILERGVV